MATSNVASVSMMLIVSETATAQTFSVSRDTEAAVAEGEGEETEDKHFNQTQSFSVSRNFCPPQSDFNCIDYVLCQNKTPEGYSSMLRLVTLFYDLICVG